ncbi:MAG: DUF2059 domain-containing protein [Thermoanaerobaculia bacterium]|nr:DUF2059 domain-containing protein [Thermoanaerobaculia bacterium]
MAEELLEAMKVPDSIQRSLALVKQMIPAQIEKMGAAGGESNAPSQVATHTAAMMDLVAQELDWEKVKGDYISLYAETFTEEEMAGILAFYKSPAGKAFVEKQPALMQRSMELSQRMMMSIMPKIQAMTKNLPKPAAEATPQQ